MTRNILLSGPPELLVRILNECQTFPELISVISTSRWVHSVWLSNMSTIVWHVGRNALPAFEYALLAVRATDVVKASIREGKALPDPFPIRSLCSMPHTATLSELKDLLDFQHLVKCVEHMCKTSEDWGGTTGADYAECILEEEKTRVRSPSELRMWRERFYRAMYRVFFAGAVFYGVYNEPFSLLASMGRPDGVPRECMRKYNEARDSAMSAPYNIHDEIFPPESGQYLQQFTVYNPSTTEEREQLVFGTFAQWIVEDGKRLATKNQCRAVWKLDSSQVSGVWEVMTMLCAYQYLMALDPKFANGNGSSEHGHRHDRADEDWPDEALFDPGWRPPRQAIPGETRDVTLILFGAFGLEDISMPAVVEEATEYQLLIANPSHLLKGSRDSILDSEGSPKNVNIHHIQAYMFGKSGLPNHNDDHEMHPLDFKLFGFILKSQFGLQFKTITFDHFDRYRFWESFVKNATIFQLADYKYVQYGFEVLRPYQPRVLSYKRIRYYLGD